MKCSRISNSFSPLSSSKLVRISSHLGGIGTISKVTPNAPWRGLSTFGGLGALKQGNRLLANPRWDISFQRRGFAKETKDQAIETEAADSSNVGGEDDSIIVEINNANFEKAVIQSPVPVILDCYADWCGPCKVLTPILEKLVNQANGAVRLAKVDVDENGELSQALQVSSIPAVFAFWKGKIVGKFVGLQDEKALKQFVDQLMKLGGEGATGKTLEQAEDSLQKGDIQNAAKLFSDILQNPSLKQEAVATAGLARCALAENNVELAKQLIENVKQSYPDDLKNPLVKKAIAAVELATSGAPSDGDQNALIDKVAKNPNDLQSRFDLAMSYNQSGKHSKALEECFEIIKREKKWKEDSARKLALKIFEALGPTHETTIQGRRRLSNLLFN